MDSNKDLFELLDRLRRREVVTRCEIRLTPTTFRVFTDWLRQFQVDAATGIGPDIFVYHGIVVRPDLSERIV